MTSYVSAIEIIREMSGMSSPLEAARVAAAVDALVVGPDDVGDRAVALDLAHDLRALVRVHLDELPVVS